MTDTQRPGSDPIPHAENVGAWVLGALDEETAKDFAAELERSPQLRAQVAHLQPVVDALPMGAPQMDAPSALRDRIMATVREEADLQRAANGEPRRARPEPEVTPGASGSRSRRFLGLRPLTALGFACVALVVGIGAGFALSTDDGGLGGKTVSVKIAFVGATGKMVDRGREGGRLELTGIPNPDKDHVYQVWLIRAGNPKPVPTDALFTPNGQGHSTVNVPGDLRDVDQVLVSEEPAGGSQQPTTEPVISATI